MARPVPIPDARRWATLDGTGLVERRTIGAPAGYETIVSPVEALVEDVRTLPGSELGPQFHLLVRLEPGDLERLTADPYLWLTFWGGIIPFALTIPDIPSTPAAEEPPMTNTSTGDPTPDSDDPTQVLDQETETRQVETTETTHTTRAGAAEVEDSDDPEPE
jgi:hypothetical protein